MYAIVEFKNGIQMVPKEWIFDRNRKCLWPNIQDMNQLVELIKDKATPQRKWKSYKVKRVIYKADTYNKGMKKLELALQFSNVEGRNSESEKSDSLDEEELPAKKKRTILPASPLPLNSDSETSMINGDLEVSTTISSPKEKENAFQWTVISKLNKIMATQSRIEERLNYLEHKFNASSSSNTELLDIIRSKMPLKSHEEIKDFDLLLMEEDGQDNVTQILKLVGGENETDMAQKILKRLLTDEIANEYSWAGIGKKKTFKNLLIPNAIYRSVRFHFPSATDEKISQAIKKWLKYANQRKLRHEMKCQLLQASVKTDSNDACKS